jgi:16S rRNA G966 N2-methylase RsmD
VVLETHGKDEVPEVEGNLARERERRYGETVVHVYRAGAVPPPEEEPSA